MAVCFFGMIHYYQKANGKPQKIVDQDFGDDKKDSKSMLSRVRVWNK